jgi:hypothetical protein
MILVDHEFGAIAEDEFVGLDWVFGKNTCDGMCLSIDPKDLIADHKIADGLPSYWCANKRVWRLSLAGGPPPEDLVEPPLRGTSVARVVNGSDTEGEPGLAPAHVQAVLDASSESLPELVA